MNEIKALVSGASKAHITVSHEGIDLHEDILKFYEACMTMPNWSAALRCQPACVRILVCVCCALLSFSLSLSLVSRLVWKKVGLLYHFPCVCVSRALLSFRFPEAAGPICISFSTRNSVEVTQAPRLVNIGTKFGDTGTRFGPW